VIGESLGANLTNHDLDGTDHEILELLAENARRTMGDMAGRVALSPSAVKRRVDRSNAWG